MALPLSSCLQELALRLSFMEVSLCYGLIHFISFRPWKAIALGGVQTHMKAVLSGGWGSFALGDKQSSGAGCLC